MYKLVIEDGTAATAKIYDDETDVELKKVRCISVIVTPGAPVYAAIELAQIRTSAKIKNAEFMLSDPLDGTSKPVRRIEFADGSGLEVRAGKLERL